MSELALSNRESEIARLRKNGMLRKEIGSMLGISERRVDSYLRSIREKEEGDNQLKGLELSRREVQVAKLTALGLTSQAIGERLGISPKTAEVYRDRVRLKFGLNSTREIPAACFQRGLMR